MTICNNVSRALKGTPFVMEERGEIEVKGKGKMMTYFLYGNGDKTIKYDENGEISQIIRHHTNKCNGEVADNVEESPITSDSRTLTNGKHSKEINGNTPSNEQTTTVNKNPENGSTSTKKGKSTKKNTKSSTCIVM